jgi:SAM-dependent methyltransferase
MQSMFELPALKGIQLTAVRSCEEYREFRRRSEKTLAERREFESAMIGEGVWTVAGTCFVCSRESEFHVDFENGWTVDGVKWPNWRESMVCRTCGLNGRMRAAVHLFLSVAKPGPAARIFLAERVTPMFRVMSTLFPDTIGAEFLGPGLPSGWMSEGGIRHEDLQAMSFPDSSLDFALSFDVLEHVPDVGRALRECARILKPEGKLFFTAPVDLGLDRNLLRARLRSDGTVEHLHPPAYHGNPISAGGSLVYTDFGWELADMLVVAGFETQVLLAWSDEFGYLGGELVLFLAIHK